MSLPLSKIHSTLGLNNEPVSPFQTQFQQQSPTEEHCYEHQTAALGILSSMLLDKLVLTSPGAQK